MATKRILIVRDLGALASYVSDASREDPGLLLAPCTRFTAEDGRVGLVLKRGSLPPVTEELAGLATQVEGSISAKALTLKVGRETTALASVQDMASVIEALAPTPWGARARTDFDAALLVPADDLVVPLMNLATMGRDPSHVSVVEVEHPDLGDRVLVWVGSAPMASPQVVRGEAPPWAVVQELLAWDEREGVVGDRAVRAYRRLGRRRVYVAWGYVHPLEGRIEEDPDVAVSKFVEADGRHVLIRATGPWEDVASRATRAFGAVRVQGEAITPGADPGRVPATMRLEQSIDRIDPVLWVVEGGEAHRLTALLQRTPESELRNLQIAELEGEDGPVFLVKEAVSQRRSARLLPLSGHTYSAHPGVADLYVPTGTRLVPRYPASVVSKAFLLRPGELTIIDDDGQGGIVVSKVAARPVDATELVDFVGPGESLRAPEAGYERPFHVTPFAPDGRLSDDDENLRERPPVVEEAPAEDFVEREEEAPVPKKGKKGKSERADKGKKGAKPVDTPATLTPSPSEPSQVDASERAAIQDPTSVDAWVALAEAKAATDPDESVRCWENALWYVSPEQEDELWRRVAASVSGSKSGLAAVWSDVLAFSRSDTRPGSAAVQAVYRRLREASRMLGKKGRWLLWREVLRVTGDDLEEARQLQDILSELAQRGVDDRELPAFVRRRILEQQSPEAARALAGGDSESAVFIDALLEYARKVGGAAGAYVAANLAWALVRAGSVEPSRKSLDVAMAMLEKEQKQPTWPKPAVWAMSAKARAAAVLERLDGPGSGTALFEEALAIIPAQQVEQQAKPYRLALARWFVALADASVGGLSLAEKGLEKAAALRIDERALLFGGDSSGPNIAAPLAALGLAEQGAALVRETLTGDLKHMLYYDALVRAMVASEGGLTKADADLVLDVLRSKIKDVDEFTANVMVAPVLATLEDPWAVATTLGKAAEDAQNGFAGALCRVVGLRTLAERGDRDTGAPLLRDEVERILRLTDLTAIWDGRESDREKCRMRVLVRLVDVVPAFGMEDGLEIVESVRAYGEADRARRESGGASAKPDQMIYNEVLSHCASAAAKLGRPTEAARIFKDTTDSVLGLLSSKGGVSPVVFESLISVAQHASDLGDQGAALALVERIAAAAKEVMGRADKTGSYYPLKAIVSCARAAVEYGDLAAAGKYLDDFFATFGDGKTGGRSAVQSLDFLVSAMDVATLMTGAARYSIATRAVEVGKAVPVTAEPEGYIRRLSEQAVGHVLSGDAAAAAALVRWKGDEELRIRDRVASEKLTAGA